MKSMLLFATTALAVPFIGSQEKRNILHPAWIKREPLEGTASVRMRIALKQQNLEKGMDLLFKISDPRSANYGQHYSADEVTEMFAPKKETVSTVKEWLINAGVPAANITTTKSRGWVDFSATVGEVENLLQAQYHLFSRDDGSSPSVSSEKYFIPDAVAPHVDFIGLAQVEVPPTPVALTRRPSRREKKFTPIAAKTVEEIKQPDVALQYCADYVTPACIRALYNIPPGKLASPTNRLGMYEADDEYYRQSDLAAFYGLFAPEIPPTFGPKVDLIDFGEFLPNASYAVGEAALDFDMAQPLIYPQTTELYQTRVNYNYFSGQVGIFNEFLDAVDGAYCHFQSHGETGDDPELDGYTPNEQCGTFTPTNVISFSYAPSEPAYPAGYLERQCEEFMKLGLQGTTLLFASGDGGVAGLHGHVCLGKDYDIFQPLTPASCPYVTTVGGTTLPSGSVPGDAEEATTSFASGGGFSNIWPAPNYQRDAISSYFATYDPGFPFYTTTEGNIPESGNGVYNRGGRAYPDLAAVADNGVIVFNGEVGRSGGTSMATPIVASMFTRINEERIAQGKKPVGFVNPALYQNPGMFNDVAIGNMASNGLCRGRGFSAVPGWDPVTGLGTPKYPEMLAYFLAMP